MVIKYNSLLFTISLFKLNTGLLDKLTVSQIIIIFSRKTKKIPGKTPTPQKW